LYGLEENIKKWITSTNEEEEISKEEAKFSTIKNCEDQGRDIRASIHKSFTSMAKLKCESQPWHNML